MNEYLYLPQNGDKTSGVIVFYGMTYAELSIFPAVDARIRELLKGISALIDPTQSLDKKD